MGVCQWHWNQSPIRPMKASRRAKTEKCTSSSVKCEGLLTIFYDCNGMVYHEFLPQDRTGNKEYYLEVMPRLRKAIRQKCLELWKPQSWILHQDNTAAHTLMLEQEFLGKINKTVFTGLGNRWLFSSSHNWRPRWKESVLLRLRRKKKNRNMSCWRGKTNYFAPW